MSEPTVTDARPAQRTRVAPFVVLAVAVVIVGLFVVLASSTSNDGDTISSYLIDKPAPSALGTTLDGEPFDLSRRKGSWVVLNFFDPTCVPCVNEHPELIEFHQAQQARPDGAELYTVINKGSDASVREFFATNGGDWPVVSDPPGSISVAFGVAQVPETWIIDPNGIVRQRMAGEVSAEFLGSYLQQLREVG